MEDRQTERGAGATHGEQHGGCSESEITRRHALRVLVRGGIVLVGGALAASAAEAAPAWVAVGPVSRFKVGVPTRVTLKPGATAYVVRQRNNTWLALSTVCTHAGGTVEWDASRNRFFCPVHRATFSIAGKNTGGPARTPLVPYPVQVVGLQVKLDASTAGVAGAAGRGGKGKEKHEGKEHHDKEHEGDERHEGHRKHHGREGEHDDD